MDRSDELAVLSLAEPMLAQIFGEIEIDRSQEDRPDAAFFYSPKSDASTSPKVRRVGVEITCVDRSDDLKYFNDENMAREHMTKRLEEVLKGNPSPPAGPLKKKSIPFGHDYLYEGVKEKAVKYPKYMGAADFEQIVLLVTSDFLETCSPDFNYLTRWTDHFLGRAHFPFSKVIFVSKPAADPVLIFDKERPARRKPARKLEHEQGFTRMDSEILPFGEASLGATLTGDALLPQREGRRRRKR